MSFQDFTLERIRTDFRISISDELGLFDGAQPVPLPLPFAEMLICNTPLAIGNSNAKARSDWLVAPLIGHVGRATQHEISVLSGAELIGHPSSNLSGI